MKEITKKRKKERNTEAKTSIQIKHRKEERKNE